MPDSPDFTLVRIRVKRLMGWTSVGAISFLEKKRRSKSIADIQKELNNPSLYGFEGQDEKKRSFNMSIEKGLEEAEKILTWIEGIERKKEEKKEYQRLKGSLNGLQKYLESYPSSHNEEAVLVEFSDLLMRNWKYRKEELEKGYGGISEEEKQGLSAVYRIIHQENYQHSNSFVQIPANLNQIVQSTIFLLEHLNGEKEEATRIELLEILKSFVQKSKVFVSFAETDLGQIQWMIDCLDRDPRVELLIYTDHTKNPYGGNIKSFILDSIRKSDRVLLMISSNSLNSQWVGFEVLSTLFTENLLSNQKLIPVDLDGAIWNDDFVQSARSEIQYEIERLTRRIQDNETYGHLDSFTEFEKREMLSDLKNRFGKIYYEIKNRNVLKLESLDKTCPDFLDRILGN